MTEGQFIKNQQGEVIGVFLTIDQYRELMEDMDDVKTFRKAKAKNEPATPLREAIALLKNVVDIDRRKDVYKKR